MSLRNKLGTLILVIFLASFISSCDTNDEPCPRFPSQYDLELTSDVIRLDLPHEILNGELVPLEVNIDSITNILFPEEEFEDFEDAFFTSITLIEEQTAQLRFRNDDQDTIGTFPFIEIADQFYEIEGANGMVLVMEVSQDCSYMELCTGGFFILLGGDFSNPIGGLSFGDIFCQGRPNDQFLPTDVSRFEDGVFISAAIISLRFELQE